MTLTKMTLTKMTLAKMTFRTTAWQHRSFRLTAWQHCTLVVIMLNVVFIIVTQSIIMLSVMPLCAGALLPKKGYTNAGNPY